MFRTGLFLVKNLVIRQGAPLFYWLALLLILITGLCAIRYVTYITYAKPGMCNLCRSIRYIAQIVQVSHGNRCFTRSRRHILQVSEAAEQLATTTAKILYRAGATTCLRKDLSRYTDCAPTRTKLTYVNTKAGCLIRQPAFVSNVTG